MITVARAAVVAASSSMPLPARNGVLPSTFCLTPGAWHTVLDCLCSSFPKVSRDIWQERFARGLVLGADGVALAADQPYRLHLRVHYYREVPAESAIPFAESILHLDDHLLIADKPHFLPVMPSGAYVNETLLARLIRRTGISDLVPLHRIDRATAGLVMFSTNAVTRARYQELFREHRMQKVYEAVAAPLPLRAWPLICRSRIVSGEPFFRMTLGAGEPNCETTIDVVERAEQYWRYELRPVTGRKHQLRVQMAELGAPILNDLWYPQLRERAFEDQTKPLQLLAKRLRFDDPLDRSRRSFQSEMHLHPLDVMPGSC